MVLVKTGIGLTNNRRNVEQIGDFILDDRRAENSIADRFTFHGDSFFHNVIDAADGQADAAAMFGVNNHLHRVAGIKFARRRSCNVPGHTNQWQNLTPVLDDFVSA